MSKPEDVSQAAWECAIAAQDAAIERCKVERLFYPFPTCNGKAVLDEAIARALDAARAEGAKTEREAMEALLKNPVAVRLNVMRGGIDASSVVMDEREACAQVADTAPIEVFATPRDIEATRFARTTIAAAIRSRP